VTERYLSPCGFIDLRLGRWQDVLADVTTCDALVTDAPYGERTHKANQYGARAARWQRGNGASWDATWAASGGERRAIDYAHWTPDDVCEFADSWHARCAGWTVLFNSYDMIPAIDDALAAHGRYTFSPLPFFSPGSRVRLAGDGPSSWTTWIHVSRPRTLPWCKWGTLPGGYVFPPENMLVVGGKPLPLMRAIVRDYTRPGDLVVDPFAGGGTTALACAIEGRRCITSEMDPVTFEKARARLARGYTRDAFADVPRTKAKQGSLV
jgi:site-specific DNA-methyltransferase (adenine-specific)